MGFIPISDEQAARFFRMAGARVRGFAAARLATRRARIIAAAGALALTIAVGVAIKPRPSAIPVQGLVLMVEARDILDEKTGLLHSRVRVVVGDTTETTLLLPPPVPDVGHFIPLQKDRSLFGPCEYRLDEETWLAVGPS